jgi:formate-dependent nitrite reductase membrane component NrfD
MVQTPKTVFCILDFFKFCFLLLSTFYSFLTFFKLSTFLFSVMSSPFIFSPLFLIFYFLCLVPFLIFSAFFLRSATIENKIIIYELDDWLTVHCSIAVVTFQLDAQNSYLFIHNTFIKILYMFRALSCSSSGGLCRNCIYVASGIVTVCMWLSCAPVHKTVTCKEWRYQRLHIYNYDVELLNISRVMLETCRGF